MSPSAGTSAGVVRVTTAGGSFTLRPAATITSLPDVTPAADVNDTVATALAVNLPGDRKVKIFQTVGDNAGGSGDVDMYSLVLQAGDQLTFDIDAQVNGSGLDSYVRLFDSNGTLLVGNDDSNGRDSFLQYSVPANGTYFLGVNGCCNGYNPTVPNSGSGGSTGTYQLIITAWAWQHLTDRHHLHRHQRHAAPLRRRLGQHGANDHDHRCRPADRRASGLHNPRQRRRHARHADGHGGAGGWRWDQPASSGAGRCDQRHGALARESVGLFLQVVPTLTDVDQGVNDSYRDGGLRLRGSGFMESDITINFDNQFLAIPVRKRSQRRLASTWRMTAWT